jgi:hypothetical protein
MQPSIVILSVHALLAAGIAHRLQEHLQPAALEIVDPRQGDAVAQISAIRPSVVILDTTDSEAAEHCPLGKLFLALPGLKVICIDPQGNQIQVVTGEKRKAVDVADLAAVIEQSFRPGVPEREA